jgi:hypothetical protein
LIAPVVGTVFDDSVKLLFGYVWPPLTAGYWITVALSTVPTAPSNEFDG